VQATFVEAEPSPDYEVELRQRIIREREVEAEQAARDKELDEESVKLEQEIEQEIRGMLFGAIEFTCLTKAFLSPELSEEERASIVTAPEFLDFVEQSSKIVQRALNDGYDYIRDYTIGAQAGG
jgi:dynein intermediate chain